MVERHIRRDPPGPSPEVARRLESRVRPMDSPECLQREIFRNARISDNPHDPAVNRALELAEQALEGFEVALREPLEQLHSSFLCSLYRPVKRSVSYFCPPKTFADRLGVVSYSYSVRSVRLKVLKNKLGAYVRLAASGETVLVTDRDRVVAELVPPRDSRSPLVEATRKAWLSAPAVVAEGPPPRLPVAPLRELVAELERDREER
jgi:antitoxin (DNA-binding transcriptional repressor) of toxin-antitoxin stability system